MRFVNDIHSHCHTRRGSHLSSYSPYSQQIPVSLWYTNKSDLDWVKAYIWPYPNVNEQYGEEEKEVLEYKQTKTDSDKSGGTHRVGIHAKRSIV